MPRSLEIRVTAQRYLQVYQEGFFVGWPGLERVNIPVGTTKRCSSAASHHGARHAVGRQVMPLIGRDDVLAGSNRSY